MHVLYMYKTSTLSNQWRERGNDSRLIMYLMVVAAWNFYHCMLSDSISRVLARLTRNLTRSFALLRPVLITVASLGLRTTLYTLCGWSREIFIAAIIRRYGRNTPYTLVNKFPKHLIQIQKQIQIQFRLRNKRET